MSSRFAGPVGVFLLLLDNNELVLQYRKNCSFSEMYGLVGGHLDGGEKVTTAIIREAKEEIGIDLGSDDLHVILTMQRPNAPYKGDPTDIIDVFIKATKYSGIIKNNEPEKCEEIDFFDINNLPVQTLPHVKRAIDLINQSQHFCIYE